MGYRSDVVLVVHKDIIPKFMDVLCVNEEARKLVFEYRDEFDKDFYEEGHIFVRWFDIKWYEGYEPIDALEAFVKENDEQTRLVRCGEEGDDTEEMGDLFSELIYPRIHNSIEIN